MNTLSAAIGLAVVIGKGHALYREYAELKRAQAAWERSGT